MDSQAALEIVLAEFLRIAEIPRPSHHEERIGAYLLDWAKAHGLSAVQDNLGNVIVEKPASAGCEAAPAVIMQAHMDMVCVAEDGVAYDPLSDGIQVINDGKHLRAKGTSLGADDGIGIALILYFLQNSQLQHGPLRAIFTVNEEDGMTSGAIDANYLDASYLINLDWEWLGSLCNSAAGGDFVTLRHDHPGWVSVPEGWASLRITLKGLLGGHSGVDIHRGRANALVCVAQALAGLTRAGVAYRIADFRGGQARNAIPASCAAHILVPQKDLSQAMQILEDAGAWFSAGFEAVETEGVFTVERLTEPASRMLDEEVGNALVSLLMLLPSGVHTMSPLLPTLVESSQNIGLLETGDQAITLSVMARSCSPFRAAELLEIDRAAAELLGFSFAQGEHTAIWAMNAKSRLTPLACEEYKTLTGTDMVVEPVHGGLECGAFSEKNPALDMIAIGPSLQNVHSPQESCDIKSIQTTVELIAAILARLA